MSVEPFDRNRARAGGSKLARLLVLAGIHAPDDAGEKAIADPWNVV
ncbi:MAG TPA: hypothetical protein VL970_03620 [Candidatus Acidoferrales bacterium]|nr:hypothetical protein [Candidatus Acidoferrales bacterium]